MTTRVTTRLLWLTILTGLLGASPASAQVSDDFSAPALDGGLWTFVNPLGDGQVIQANGLLSLDVPGGVTHDLWTGGNNSVRIVQPATNGDFELETRFESVPYSRYQIQGVLVEQDATNYLRVDYYHDGSSLHLYAAGMVNNVPVSFGDSQVSLDGDLRLRINRSGDSWTVSYLFDGNIWVQTFQFDLPLVVNSTGVHAGNVGTPVPAFLAVVDYFFNNAAPIVPEDGTVSDLQGPAVSGQSVLPDVDAARFLFTTDEPAYGQVKYGLTPALELGAAGAAGLRLSHQIDLGGLTAAETYHYQIVATDVAGNETQDTVGQFTTASVGNSPPAVSLTAPAGGSTFEQGAPILIVADAGDTDGTVTQVEFLADGQVIGTVPAAPWEFNWMNAPVGNHLLTARATDDQGATTTSAAVAVMVSFPAGTPVAVSDDFSAVAFDDNLWTFVDPLGGASYSQVSGLLTLSVPAGTAYDLWNQGNNSVRVVQPVADTDIGLEAKFETSPLAVYQIEGLLVEQDATNFIRFDYFHDGVNLHLFAADIRNNVPTTRLNQILPPGAPLWLRLIRTGNQWIGQYSQDGQNWTQAVSFARDLTMNNVGVFAGNAGPSPAFDAVVDYFFDLNNPIDPEDGTVVDVTPPTVSNLAVVPAVNSAAASFTTNEPAFGRVHYGLTAALELGTVGGAALQTSHAVDLTNLTAATTYFYQIEVEDSSANLAQLPVSQFTTLAVANELPQVALTAPAPGAQYALQDTIFMAATASDNDGAVVLVEFLADGQVVGSAAVEPWEFAWVGAPVGNFNLVARAIDDIGGQGQSAPVAITVRPAPGDPAAVSDDFSALAFNDSLWTFIDPRGDSSYYQANGLLNLSVPAGVNHDLWTSGNETARMVQTMVDADFSFDVKFESLPQQAYQIQGLLLEAAPGDYIRVDFFHDNSSVHLFAASFVGNVPTVRGDVVIPPTLPVWLRVERGGNDFTVSWSDDGSAWQPAFAFTHALVLDQVGLYAGNLGSPAPAFEVLVDYFFDNNAPISPEDDGVVDIWAPVVSNIVVLPNPQAGTALVTCTTNEPATTVLSYGLDTNYGTDVAGTTVDGYSHEFVLSGLVLDATYDFAIVASDTLGNPGTSGNRQFVNTEIKPTITVWGGNDQKVGHLGVAQADFNLMGNVLRWEETTFLGATLNGGTEVPLNWGQSGTDYGDGRRLGRDGDFNFDVPLSQLQMGANTISLRAVAGNGAEDIETVTVTRGTGSSVMPKIVTWGNVADPQDVGQRVDGNWDLEGNGLRTLSTGYDRIFLLGEESWQDYEVLCPITINEVLPPVVGVGGPGLGFLMRFTGHIVGGHRNWPEAQPKWGYQPFGGLGWLRWESGPSAPPVVQFYHGDYDVEVNYGTEKASGPGIEPIVPEAAPFGSDAAVTSFGQAAEITAGVTFMMKMRCETMPDAENGDGVTMYSYKVWLATASEPVAWDFQFVQQSKYALRQGSVGLLAHYVDVTFGNVTVVELAGAASVGDAPAAPRFALGDAYPNPFNPMTRIAFELPATGPVRVSVFDIRGHQVAVLQNGELPAGRHELVWRGSDAAGRAVSSGQYFYRLDAGGLTAVKKMLLLK